MFENIAENKKFEEERKTVSIDFDETFTTDPIAWLKVIDILKKSGFNVICCTARFPHEYPEDLEILERNGIEIYFASRNSKKEYLESKGVNVDIWIDDNPFSVLNNIN